MVLATLAPGVNVVVLDERHAPALFATVDAARGDLAEWLPWVDGTRGVDDARAFLAGARQRREREGALALGVLAEGRVLGVVSQHFVDRENLRTEIGYWLDPPSRGRGLMTAAVRTLTRHAFHDQGLHRVEIKCAAPNAASRRVAERAGFTHEATLREAARHRGAFVDVALYVALAGSWPDA